MTALQVSNKVSFVQTHLILPNFFSFFPWVYSLTEVLGVCSEIILAVIGRRELFPDETMIAVLAWAIAYYNSLLFHDSRHWEGGCQVRTVLSEFGWANATGKPLFQGAAVYLCQSYTAGDNSQCVILFAL